MMLFKNGPNRRHAGRQSARCVLPWTRRVSFRALRLMAGRSASPHLRSRECYFSITRMRTELVTTLKRKATAIISEVDRERVPVLITQHGRPAAYLVDVETYERLNQRLAILEGIARGEQAIEQGRVVSHAEAKKRLARWLS